MYENRTLTPISILRIASLVVVLFVSPPNVSLSKADTFADFMLLAFPDEPPAESLRGALESLNSLGALKLTKKAKVCVFGSDAAARRRVDGMLDEVLSDFPADARIFIDRECGSTTISDWSKLNVPIWISRSPWLDLRAHLMPYLSRVIPQNYESVVRQYEQTDPNDLPTISVLNNGTEVRGMLVLKDGDDERLRETIYGFVFMLLNPKSSVAKYNPPLAYRSESGQLKSLNLTKVYLTLLYSGAVRLHDSREKFEEAVHACIDAGNC